MTPAIPKATETTATAESIRAVRMMLEKAGATVGEMARIIDRETNLPQLLADRDKLQRFKDYVHKRLDDAGIPVDPDSSHKAEGCRIGGRLDCVFAERDALLSRLAAAEAESRWHWCPREECPYTTRRRAREGQEPEGTGYICLACQRDEAIATRNVIASRLAAAEAENKRMRGIFGLIKTNAFTLQQGDTHNLTAVANLIYNLADTALSSPPEPSRVVSEDGGGERDSEAGKDAEEEVRRIASIDAKYIVQFLHDKYGLKGTGENWKFDESAYRIVDEVAEMLVEYRLPRMPLPAVPQVPQQGKGEK